MTAVSMTFSRATVALAAVSSAVASLAAAGCSSGDDGATPASTTAPPATAPPVPATTTTTPAPPGEVRVDVAAPARSIDATLEVTLASGATSDPFGTFAACSAFQTSLAAYAVSVSDPGGDVVAVSLLSGSPVTGAGTYDADVRVELAGAEPIVAVGTMSVGASLTVGSFLAADQAGGEVRGSFECSGAAAPPAPLAPGADDGRLDTVEVVARLGRAGAERVVGLAIDVATTGDGVTASCPGAEGRAPGDGVLVEVDGDASVGSLTGFALTGGAVPGLRLRVEDVEYAVEAAGATVVPGATAGTFGGAAGDVTLDGAFRCT